MELKIGMKTKFDMDITEGVGRKCDRDVIEDFNDAIELKIGSSKVDIVVVINYQSGRRRYFFDAIIDSEVDMVIDSHRNSVPRVNSVRRI